MKKMKKIQYPPLKIIIMNRERNTRSEDTATVMCGMILSLALHPKKVAIRSEVILYPSKSFIGRRLAAAVAKLIAANVGLILMNTAKNNRFTRNYR